jgi:acyl-CoA reductase-like NAD-dependent aldehyde dehydrogenase
MEHGHLLLDRTEWDRFSMELGGNAPFLVFPDFGTHQSREAYIREVVSGIMQSKFRNSGQTCVSVNRVLVHSSLHDELVGALVERVQRDLRVGDGLMDGMNMGPLISTRARDKCLSLIQDAVDHGAKVYKEFTA